MEFGIDTWICITGADFSPIINNLPCKINKPIEIKKGDILSFGRRMYGCRCYLSVSGGFNSKFFLGSSSMYEVVTGNSKLVKNEVLEIGTSLSINKKTATIKFNSDYLMTEEVKVFKGPEFHYLSEGQKEILFSKTFTVSGLNNRMAYQMEETLEHNIKSIITSLVYPGTVQLTPSGNIIVLMRDCQATGGYPRILQVSDY